MDNDFYFFLRAKHETIDNAIAWAILWEKCGQPALPRFGEFTMRAMSAHISRAFEGKVNGGDSLGTNYLATQYGPLIFEAMCMGRYELVTPVQDEIDSSLQDAINK